MEDFLDPMTIVAHLELRDGMRVADLGSGSGHFALAAARRVGHSGKVYAVDVQKSLLEKLAVQADHARVKNLEVVWGDFDEPNGTTLEDASQDAVIVSNVLFQAEHRASLAEEAARILKPGGKVLVLEWTDSFGGMGPAREQVVSEDETKSIFAMAGLAFDDAFKAGSHHYGLIFSKA